MTAPPATARPALLFDLDGTLCETDHLHFEAYRDMLAPLGRPLTQREYDANIMGFAGADIFGYLFPGMPQREWEPLVERKEAIFRERLDALPPLAGAPELIDAAIAAAVGVIVVTNAPRESALIQIGKIGLADRLGAPVLGLELSHPKPDPMPYRVGLERLGADPARSVAFEDSRSGIRSARGAGLPVVGLATTLDEATLVDAGAAFGIRDYADPRLRGFLEARLGVSLPL
jgi:beta-phosphoglucomutase